MRVHPDVVGGIMQTSNGKWHTCIRFKDNSLFISEEEYETEKEAISAIKLWANENADDPDNGISLIQ